MFAECFEHKDDAVMIFAVYNDDGTLAGVQMREIAQSGAFSIEFPYENGGFKIFIWDKNRQETYSEMFSNK